MLWMNNDNKPMTPAVMNGASSWLTTLPLESENFVLQCHLIEIPLADEVHAV